MNLKAVWAAGMLCVLALGLSGCSSGGGSSSSSGGSTYTGPYIYISDTGNSRLVRINDMTGAGLVALGTPGSGTYQFSKPAQLAFDSAGNLYIADAGNNRIVKATITNGQLSSWTVFTTANNVSFNNPQGVAVDSAGNIYVADTGNSRVCELSSAGATLYTFSTGGGLTLKTPNSVAVDSTGNIYCTDATLKEVVKFAPKFASFVSLTGSYTNLDAVTVDSSNDFYLGQQTTTNPIYLYNSAAIELGVYSGAGLQASGFALDSSNHLYVADGPDNQIAETSIVAGAANNALIAVYNNGLSHPTGIAFH